MKHSEYKVVMTERNRELQEMYQSLLSNTINELQAKHSLQTVKYWLKFLVTPHGVPKSLYTREVEGHIRDLQTYDEFQKYLGSTICSWFNISLIVSLRKVLLLSPPTNYQGDPEVVAYKEHTLEFFKRCCFKRTRYDEHKLQPHTEIVCAVFTDFKEVHERQVREFEHQLRQTIALPECERRVDEESGDLIFRVQHSDEVNQGRENEIPLAICHEGYTKHSQAEPEEDPYKGRRVKRDLKSSCHPCRRFRRRNKITTIFRKMFGCLFTVVSPFLLVGLYFLLSYAPFFFFDASPSYQTISLGSTRVFANTSTVLRKEITVSDFSPHNSFTFSTRSEGVTCIYITDCRPFNESISRQDSIESGRTVVFSQHIATGPSITIQVETESGMYVNCSTELIVFDRGRYEYMFVKTGKKKWPFKEFCISKTFQFHFEPQKMSYFSFVIATSEPVRFSVTGNVLRYNILARCLISNTNNCIINKKRHFADKHKVCITATPKDSDVPYSDIDYGIKTTSLQWGITILRVLLFCLYEISVFLIFRIALCILTQVISEL